MVKNRIFMVIMRIFPWVLVIEGLKKELERCRGDRFVHVFQELMPIRSRCDEEGGAKLEVDCKDKKKWMSSAQLWSDYSSDDNRNDDDQSVADEVQRRNFVRYFLGLRSIFLIFPCFASFVAERWRARSPGGGGELVLRIQEWRRHVCAI